ncbi:hypothetical protein [Nocardia sp. NPDC046763]|uniref:hypothetical protein n=1 Tax=Nocardia sp. NPDC046763 TaxID=3155256 RepID=UPI003405D5F0
MTHRKPVKKMPLTGAKTVTVAMLRSILDVARNSTTVPEIRQAAEEFATELDDGEGMYEPSELAARFECLVFDVERARLHKNGAAR